MSVCGKPQGQQILRMLKFVDAVNYKENNIMVFNGDMKMNVEKNCRK